MKNIYREIDNARNELVGWLFPHVGYNIESEIWNKMVEDASIINDNLKGFIMDNIDNNIYYYEKS